MKKDIQIAYIGGGSRLWARSLMNDLALETSFQGTVKLYDIDYEAAKRNETIGNMLMSKDEALGNFMFKAVNTLEEALTEADFVLISILPGTFKEMSHYVHLPEKYGIYQTVGDTVGPAGIFRSLIMMPMIETIALAIKAYCPKAFVLNFTNPMTMTVQMLYEVFPEIRAFGNCHEVFFVQKILARVLREKTGIETNYRNITINPQGINHFTWINYAVYKDIDLLPLYRDFVNHYFDQGLLVNETYEDVYPFGSAERVKLDLFKKYTIIAAAGDRHLVEFFPANWYLKDAETIKYWKFHRTPVELRINQMKRNDQHSKDIINGNAEIHIYPSGEEGIAQIKALLGLGDLITNVNMPNLGQIENLPKHAVVETNARFTLGKVQPILSGPMDEKIVELTTPHLMIHKHLINAYRDKRLDSARLAFQMDPLINSLSSEQKEKLFDEIKEKMGTYLDVYV
jgi:alpha-galactosidase/6-phospho-beta-glucosidase family protein